MKEKDYRQPPRTSVALPLFKGVVEFMEQNAWAITPEWLNKMQGIVGRKMHGHELSDNKMKEMGYSHTMEIMSGKAIIPINGPTFKKANMMTEFSGATSLEVASNDFKRALVDNSVSEIILRIDSPGGTVDGTKEFADFIYNSRGIKPITAFYDGQATSAAMWYGSAADKMVASSETVMVGSVGVITSTVDYSKWEEKVGVKTTYIYKGKYKGIANSAEPMSTKGKEYIENRIDGLYGIFVESIARNYGISIKETLIMTDESKVFNGKEALKNGMINSIQSFDDLISENKTTKEEGTMTIDQLKAEDPSLFQLIEASAREGYVAADSLDEAKNKVAGLEQSITGLSAKCEELEGTIKAQEKTIAVQEDAVAKARAGAIEKAFLSASDIPDNLHSKVVGTIDYHAHMDGASLKEEAFRSAFNAEVKTWETLLAGNGNATGSSDAKIDTPLNADAQYAAENEEILKNI